MDGWCVFRLGCGREGRLEWVERSGGKTDRKGRRWTERVVFNYYYDLCGRSTRLLLCRCPPAFCRGKRLAGRQPPCILHTMHTYSGPACASACVGLLLSPLAGYGYLTCIHTRTEMNMPTIEGRPSGLSVPSPPLLACYPCLPACLPACVYVCVIKE